jgi:Mg2+ and Co2+ transporter CorA
MENKRVSISYTIDLDELPSETSRLFDKFLDLSDTLTKARNHDKERILSMDMLREVESLRKRLAQMDFVLMDIANIVQSYLSHQLQQEDEEQEGEVTTNNEFTPDPTQQVENSGNPDKLFSDLSELNEKLIAAQNALEQDEIPAKG